MPAHVTAPRPLVPQGLSRRRFLVSTLALGASQLTPLPAGRLWAQPKLPAHPFTLGVASGYPTPTGVALWTRLAPAPLVPGGGMPAEVFPVEWEVATDERMSQIVQRGLEPVYSEHQSCSR